MIKSILAKCKIKFSVLINAALLLLVVYFIIHFLEAQWPKISTLKVHFNGSLLALTFFIFEIYWCLQILNWRNIMCQQGVRLPFLQTSYFYFISCLLAYIPGKVGNVIGMASLADKYQISKTKTVTTVFFIQIYALISGALVICLSQSFLSPQVKAVFSPILPFIFVALIISLIAISQKFIAYPQKIAAFLLKRSFDKPLFPYRYHIINILNFSGCWFVLVLSLWCLLKSADSTISFALYLDVMNVFIASYLVGLLAVILPSGLGLVELGLSYGYSLICHPKIALVGALGFRFLTLLTIMSSLLGIFMIKYFLKRIGREMDDAK